MKRFISFLFLFICLNNYSSSANETAEPSPVSTNQSGKKSKWTYRTAPDGFKWLPFEDEFGCLGVKDKNGRIIVPSFYTNIEYNEGFFIVKDRHAIYSIYLNTGELFLPANNIVIVKFDKTIKNSPFILTTNKGKWCAMSRKGKMLIAEDFYWFIQIDKTDDERYIDKVKDWVFRVGKDGYMGIVDSLGSVIIPLKKYNEIERMWNKDIGITYSFRIYGDTPKSGICDSKGNVYLNSDAYKIWVETGDDGSPCHRSYYLGHVIDADMKGKIKPNQTTTPKNLKIDLYLNKVKYDLVLTPQNKMGVEKGNKIVVPSLYDKIIVTGNYFQVTKGSYCGIYDNFGKCVVAPDKYNIIVDMGNHFFVKLDTMSTCINHNGQEYLPIQYGYATPFKVGNDTFLIVSSHKNNKRSIFYEGKQLTDFSYRDIGFMEDQNSGKCLGFYIFDDCHRVGLCRLDGKEIIEPMYSDISLVKHDGKVFYKIFNGKAIGLYDQEGRMLITPELFSDISFSGKKIIATGYDRRCEFNFKGKLLLDSHPNTERDNYIKMADKEFEEEDWGSAAKYYGKAIEYWESASLYFNRAISYYNDSKYNKAIDDFNRCLSLKPSQNLIDRSRSLIAKARDLQAEKIARREAFWGNVVGLVLGAAATYVQVKYSSQNGSSSSYAANSYKRDKSLDYLLDPNYTMQQVQLENWREYMAMTDGGRTMSYEQWYALKAQSMSSSNNGESSGGHSSGSSSSSNKSYSKDCRLCYGSGDCRTCEGRGYYFNSLNLSQRLPCPNCYQHNGKCSSCGGTGKK